MSGSYIRLLRPWQWTKNAFVVMPLLFGCVLNGRYDESTKAFLEAHPNITVFPPNVISTEDILLILAALIAFCCWSSSIYVLNDLIDREQDRVHDRKSRRPIASGEITPGVAACLAVGLAAIPFAVLTAISFLPCSIQTSTSALIGSFMLVGLAFLANGLCYCLFFRSKVFLDVISIAIGFVLRVVAGCVIIGIEPSSWILVCTFTLALFLAFGKRKMECVSQGATSDYRSALAKYSTSNLNVFLGISAAVCLVSYLLYTLDQDTVALHGTKDLIYTVPFVFYGVFRYVQAADSGEYDGPDEFLLRDYPIQINIVLWAACAAYILWL
ncbi:MAG: UbiA prenyltransferase family protein [Thermoguttaceae bacterium]|nr:UbiA prenyltransferase family protein [Thermoguttaceae bacterium]